MRLGQTILTLAPALAALGILWVSWGMLEEFAMYAPPMLLGIPLLALLPLAVQLYLWAASEWRRIPHPFGIVLPLGLLLVLPLWPVGTMVARCCPGLCDVITWIEVKPEHPGKFGPTAYFSLTASGRGNPDSFEFSSVTVLYTLEQRRKDDLYIFFPRWEGFYINTYTTYFPVTREKILEYVQGSDDFPDGEAEAITDELWTVLHNLAERRNLPPVVYQGWDDPGPRIVYWVEARNVYLATAALCAPVLLGVSWFLARWYSRFIPDQRDPGGGRPDKG